MKLQDLQDLGLASDEISYKSMLLKLIEKMGFERMSAVLRLGDADGRKMANTVVDNTPEAIKSITMDPAMAWRDPCFLRQMQSTLPFIYDQEFYTKGNAGDLWDCFAPFGYRTGISICLHAPGHKRFLLSIDRHEALPEDDHLAMRLLADTQLMAVYANAAADRIFKLERAAAAVVPKLTAKETEVLRWCMAGKSSWEIGEILSSSENTINFHIKNAVRKLNAVNRRDAVVKGMSLGIL